MQVEINGAMIVLANIYGPNYDDHTVFQDFFENIERYSSDVMIMGGDWNTVLTEFLGPKELLTITGVKKLMDYKVLIDIWRLDNPKKKRFSY